MRCLVQVPIRTFSAKGTGEIGSLYRGFIVSRLFSIRYTITGLKNIVCYTKDFVYRGSFNQGSTVSCFSYKILKVPVLKVEVCLLVACGHVRNPCTKLSNFLSSTCKIQHTHRHFLSCIFCVHAHTPA